MLAEAPWSTSDLHPLFMLAVYLLSLSTLLAPLVVLKAERSIRLRVAMFLFAVLCLGGSATASALADEPTACHICRSQNLDPSDFYWWYLGCWAC